jgi:hypothetical protein
MTWKIRTHLHPFLGKSLLEPVYDPREMPRANNPMQGNDGGGEL